MSGPYFVETLARNGEVRHRERFAQLPIRIGRGYDNNLILDDTLVAPHHALIEAAADSTLIARDAGGGLYHGGGRVAQLALDGNTVFRLGHTSLRVRTAGFDVTSDQRRERSAWDGALSIAVGFALVVLLSLWSTWVTDTEGAEPIQYVVAQAGMLTFVVIWCGLWALAGRLFGGRMSFGRHLLIAGCGLVIMEIVDFLLGTAAYSLSLEQLTSYGSHLMIALGFGIVYAHLLAINPTHRRGFAITCVILALIGSGIGLMFNYQKTGRIAGELYLSELKSPRLRIVGAQKVDDFFGSAASLQAKVDAARSEKVKLDGDGEP